MAESRPIFTAAVVLLGSSITRTRKLTRRGPVWFVEAMWGPSLASFGVPTPLADPTLFLFDHTGALIAANDNWKQTQQTQIQATGLAPPNDLEAAILVLSRPGPTRPFSKAEQ